ncbi:MAG: aconitase family protein [Pedobacter sp.]|jgi:3-isopropylmalate/(R)-2-methylmalate dehydratase large subunit
MAYTLFDKIWNTHVVSSNLGFPDTLYIDAHLINKVTSPGAFEGLRKRHISVFRPGQTLVLKDAAFSQHLPLSDLSRFQLDLYNRNCSDFGLERTEQNLIDQTEAIAAFPGQTLVCDQKYTENMGALGVLAIGISELLVEQVLATQCLLINKPKRMKIEVNGRLAKGLGVKDINHYLLSEISADGANGYFIEYAGDTILDLDMQGRMTICNMSKEIGALGGLIAPDETTFEYIRRAGMMPESENPEETLSFWGSLYSDETSVFDEVLEFDAEDIGPGNYGIGISRLIPSKPANERSGMITHDGAAIIAGYNDTDYLLNHLESIEDYESSAINKIFNGA